MKLCQISHDGLIMDWLSIENLYGIPRVKVSYFSPKIDTWETKVCEISVSFYEIQIWFLKGKLWWFSLGHQFKIEI